jgi:hypothetical protein
MKVDRFGVGVRGGEWVWLMLALVAMLFVATQGRAATNARQSFASPEDAAAALVKVVKARDRGATLAVLGSAAEWISSGDAAADRALADRFVAAYEAQHAIARDGDRATLTIGDDRYPFAFPIVRHGERWRFDTEAGKEELLARRIGENELNAINVLQAIVDAQIEYASEDRMGDGLPAYAQRLASTSGHHDGLYWPAKPGERPSPLGLLVAQASAQGYRSNPNAAVPFHGYYFRLLKGQGKHAASGAVEYVVRGRAIGGFAVVAYPARYGNSGVMTFIVNQDGKVHQTDLGRETAARAAAMQRYDPGPAWVPVAQR